MIFLSSFFKTSLGSPFGVVRDLVLRQENKLLLVSLLSEDFMIPDVKVKKCCPSKKKTKSADYFLGISKTLKIQSVPHSRFAIFVLLCFALGPHLAALTVTTPGHFALRIHSWQPLGTIWDAGEQTWVCLMLCYHSCPCILIFV